MQKNSPDTESLWSLFWTFLKIGSTAFGGFMALISVVQNEVVERRRLMAHEDMLNGISLATILPGPIAVNVIAYVGYRLRGALGAIVAATAVTLPSFLLLLGLSYAYFAWGSIPAVEQFFKGFIPAVTAIIVSAAWNMGRKTLTGWPEAVIAVLALSVLLGIGGFYSTLAIVAASGVLGVVLFRPAPAPNAPNQPTANKGAGGGKLYSVAPVLGSMAHLLTIDPTAAGKLFVTFAGMSVMLFGGGFVFIPLIQEIVVDGHGWVTQQEFIDSIALGQVTPGPILISATFIGYKVAGLLGAVAATVGIFAPPAVLMLISTHYLDKIKGSVTLKGALRGIRSAVIGMIAAAAYVVGATAEANWVSLVIFAAALAALMRFKVEVAWVIPSAGVAGLLLY